MTPSPSSCRAGYEIVAQPEFLSVCFAGMVPKVQDCDDWDCRDGWDGCEGEAWGRTSWRSREQTMVLPVLGSRMRKRILR